jgi:dTDP-4-amino-4,6-dideoxygalactose transaminase
MRVPFLDLLRQYHEVEADLDSVIKRTLDNGVYILGAEVAAFEREWAAYCGVSACAGLGNGTDAIVLALWASGAVQPGRGDEVISTPLTAGYTALAIQQAGAVPVFADIEARSYTLDPAAIERAITPRTRAIMPVHLYGQMAQMDAINEIAWRHNLIVIEDAAQAHGAAWRGQRAGAHSHAATYSFYPTKNLGAFGDGGAVVSDDAALIERVKALRQGGHLPALQQATVGMNSRLDELHAAMLRVKLRKLGEWTRRRQQLARFYSEELKDTRLVLPETRAGAEHVYHLFVVRHPERERLRAYLAERNVETLIHYPFVLHQQPLFKRAEQMTLPVAENVVRQIFSLPLYPQLSDAEAARVVEAILEFEAKERK